MKRRDFIKSLGVGILGALVAPTILKSMNHVRGVRGVPHISAWKEVKGFPRKARGFGKTRTSQEHLVSYYDADTELVPDLRRWAEPLGFPRKPKSTKDKFIGFMGRIFS